MRFDHFRRDSPARATRTEDTIPVARAHRSTVAKMIIGSVIDMAIASKISRRQTRQRRIVYETVVATDVHPTAEWVYERVRERLPRISLGTVYRNLRLLVAERRLRAWTRGRISRYDADLSAHDHFSCRGCGLLLDLPRGRRGFAEEYQLAKDGHRVEDRILEFIGLCRQCRRKGKTGGKQTWLH